MQTKWGPIISPAPVRPICPGSEQESLFFRRSRGLIVGPEDAELTRPEPDLLADHQLQRLVALARQFDFDDYPPMQ